MKIICIARNYLSHAEEFGNSLQATDDPVFFIKPDTALLRNNDPFYIPHFSSEIDYETELVVRISRVGRSIAERFAHRYYNEVGLGIDFTARDLQRECIAKGLPWEVSKGFDRSAAVSPRFIPLDQIGGDVQNLDLRMELNSELKQYSSTARMIFSVDRIISHVSRFVTLRMGDYIFTGTPAGVGRVAIGDRICAWLNGQMLLDFEIK